MNAFSARRAAKIETGSRLAVDRTSFGMVPLGRIKSPVLTTIRALWKRQFRGRPKIAKAPASKDVWQGRAAHDHPSDGLHRMDRRRATRCEQLRPDPAIIPNLDGTGASGPGLFATAGASTHLYDLRAVHARRGEPGEDLDHVAFKDGGLFLCHSGRLSALSAFCRCAHPIVPISGKNPKIGCGEPEKSQDVLLPALRISR